MARVISASVFMFYSGQAAESSGFLAPKEANATRILCSPALFNNTKHNKNIFSLYGIFVTSLSISITLGLGISSRFGLVTVSQAAISFFFYFCLFAVLLPTIYFMRNPKHLISVLQDHNFPWILKF